VNGSCPQRKVINRLLDGFDGKLSTSKYAKLAKCSTDTALRDNKLLLRSGISHSRRWPWTQHELSAAEA